MCWAISCCNKVRISPSTVCSDSLLTYSNVLKDCDHNQTRCSPYKAPWQTVGKLYLHGTEVCVCVCVLAAHLSVARVKFLRGRNESCMTLVQLAVYGQWKSKHSAVWWKYGSEVTKDRKQDVGVSSCAQYNETTLCEVKGLSLYVRIV